MKLGFTTFLAAYNDLLDLKVFGASRLSFHFRSTQPTGLDNFAFW